MHKNRSENLSGHLRRSTNPCHHCTPKLSAAPLVDRRRMPYSCLLHWRAAWARSQRYGRELQATPKKRGGPWAASVVEERRQLGEKYAKAQEDASVALSHVAALEAIVHDLLAGKQGIQMSLV